MEYWGQQAKSSQSLLPTEECPDHPGEWLNTICLNHKTLCCSTCVTYNHRTCPKLKCLPAISTDIKESQDLANVDHTIDQFIKFAEEMLKSDKKSQTSIDQSMTDFLDTINTIREQTNEFFDLLEEKANTEMDKCHADTKSSLHQHLKDLNEAKDKLTQLQMTIQSPSTANEAQLFIKMFMTQQKLPEIQTQLQKMAQIPQTTKFNLTKDPKLQEMFSTVKSLVKIEKEIITTPNQLPNIKPLQLLQSTQSTSPPTPMSQPSRRKQTPASSFASTLTKVTPTDSGSTPLKQKQTQRYKATNGLGINVKMSSDKQNCKILGSCQMPGGDILLADFDNSKVKRLKRNYELTDYLGLQESPIATCCLGEDEAVATGYNKTIYFLSITSRKMSVTRSISLDHFCNGIAHNNGRLFVANGGSKINIYTLSGKCLKIIKRGYNVENMFSVFQHICVSPDGSKIYIADCNKGLVTLDIEGNRLSTYSSGDLRGACDVCVDNQGRVLVCGNKSDNVLQLEEGGTTVVGGVVSNKDGIKHPRSLSIDTFNSRLIVWMWHNIKNDYNHIRVFDLNLVG